MVVVKVSQENSLITLLDNMRLDVLYYEHTNNNCKIVYANEYERQPTELLKNIFEMENKLQTKYHKKVILPRKTISYFT